MLKWWQFVYLVPLNTDISTYAEVMTVCLPCASQHRHINWCWSDDNLFTLCLSTLTYQLMLKWWQFVYLVPLNTHISTYAEVMSVCLPCASQHRHINWCCIDDSLFTLWLLPQTYLPGQCLVLDTAASSTSLTCHSKTITDCYKSSL